MVSIVLATLAVAFNLYWRLRYLFVTDVAFGPHDVAVIITTLLYGGVAMVALVIGSVWLTRRRPRPGSRRRRWASPPESRACWCGWPGVGRDVDAFHGIAENTSTAAVGYEGYLAWAAAAAIVAPTTLYAVFLVKPPTMAVYRGAALKCLTLIAFWTFAAAGLRVTDYLIALWLDLPRSIYDTFALPRSTSSPDASPCGCNSSSPRAGCRLVIAAFSGCSSSSPPPSWSSASRSPRGTPTRRREAPTPSTATTWLSRSPACSTS